MKSSLYFLILSCLYSCVSYQTISMSQIHNEETAVDSVKIDFQFQEKSCVMKISIENSSQIPIIVDWKKSAFVLNGKSLPIVDKNGNIHVEAEEGKIFSNPNNNYLPPNSLTQIKVNQFIDFISFNPEIRKNNGKKISYNKMKTVVKGYDTTNTPLTIRVYISYYFENDQNKILKSDQTLYLAKVTENRDSPKKSLEPNQFYVQNRRIGGGVIFFASTTTAILTYAILKGLYVF